MTTERRKETQKATKRRTMAIKRCKKTTVTQNDHKETQNDYKDSQNNYKERQKMRKETQNDHRDTKRL